MTDNSDLLGAAAPVTPPKRGRGRPKKVVVATDPASPAGDMTVTTVAEVQPNGDLKILDVQHAEQVPADTTPASVPPELEGLSLISTSTDVTGALVDKAVESVQDKEALAVAKELAKLDAETAERKRQEAMDELLGVEHKPAEVSADYALATANRITQGFAKREYAYQRLLRSGKKL